MKRSNQNKKIVAIRLTNIEKKYILHHDKPTLMEHMFKGRNEYFLALKYINLTVRGGEKIGIIGSNGSGKTTLLKIIARITKPSSGTIETKGKIVSLIDLEAGFHPDLTGIQNIYLSGMLLGLSRRDVDKRLTKIIEFADIAQFIDTPLYTYSMGMKLRLGFAVALHSDPDTLLLDESINVGDQSFKDKVRRGAKHIFRSKTLFVVSHDMYTIIDYCNRVIVMEKGSIAFDGDLWEASRFYYHNQIPSEIAWYLKIRRNKHITV